MGRIFSLLFLPPLLLPPLLFLRILLPLLLVQDPVVQELLDTQTRIPGLWQTGQDTLICGVRFFLCHFFES